MTLGEQLKHYRKVKQLTQKQVADQLFVSDKTISKWEVGKGYPDLQTLPKIASLLNTTVDDLLNERTPVKYYEYKSQRQFNGKPLCHIVIPTIHKELFSNNFITQYKALFDGTIPKAQGILAIGVKAKGLISMGLVAQGLLSMGIFSIGLLSFGVATVGLIAIGDLAIGMFSVGNISFGLFVLANLALGIFTSGNLTAGWTAIGNQSFGPHRFSLGDDFTLKEYQEAVIQLRYDLRQPFADIFYEFNLWLGAHPLVILGVTLSFIALLCLLLSTIYVKRHKIFVD